MKKELVEVKKTELILPKCTLTENGMGLIVSKNATKEDLIDIGKRLKTFESGVQFWIGDWINANWGKYEHGKYEEAEGIGFNKNSLMVYASISKSIKTFSRLKDLTFEHHVQVAKFSPKDKNPTPETIQKSEELQQEWLQKAVENEWSVRELRNEIQEANKPETPPLGDTKYDIYYADPPWEYDFSETVSREIEQKYPTMSLVKIKELKPPTENNALLFLWATAPKLREALEVMESWGFEYKTHAIWDKEVIGMGYWFRGQHELLLVGVKGSFSPPEESDRVSSIFRFKRTVHSKKPSKIMDLIDKWYPESKGYKKRELFQREKRKEWDGWGSEVV